ncbi:MECHANOSENSITIVE ION CHANNEL PROTEIN 9 [Salix koriyanagi]|uniref:Mechanosensitive ion channel protein n=1 Tax=Salix koriyanagi TaxID=2511006 RepID=A0A9Q0VC43_9ROSI|nr:MECHANOSENSITIVE ION CHANNEL PROTEIN 9 [Salix koriyanagi]
MDVKEGVRGEILMSEKRAAHGGDVLIAISSEETSNANVNTKILKGPASKDPENLTPRQSRPNSPFRESSNGGVARSVPFSCPSPEISRSGQTQRKPPKIPNPNDNLTRRRSLTRSVYSKPKSRFGEQPYAINSTVLEENVSTLQEQIATASPQKNLLTRGSPNNKSASTVITPKTPLMASPGGPADEEDEEEVWKRVESSKQKKLRRIGAKAVIEWVAFLCILGCLIASLTVEKLEKATIWDLEFWKWCVLVMVIFSGMLVTNWFMHVIVFLIERNFLLKKKVLYFVHGLKKSIQVFIWIALILLAWVLLINRGVERSKTATKILGCITVTLMSILIGSFLWFLKTLSLKILASNFHVSKFFDRIQESVFHQYVLQTLSGPPLIEEAERVGRSPSMGQLSFRSTKKGKATKEKKVIDMAKVHKMKQGKVSAWTMKVLVDAVTSSGLSTISNTLDESFAAGEVEQSDKEITNEMEATAAAYYIFKNVAQPGCKYIDEDDLLRFMIKEEVDLVFPLLEGCETGRIDRKALTNWVVRVYNGRKALAHSLNDTKTAVKQLHKLVTGILLQLLCLGSTCKTMFEAIIFVFVMHPFDVGDRCVVDGVPVLVEEMNILNTVFLKLDNEKIYYPNSVLATKPIGNYFRSPDMGDTVEFAIDFATTVEKLGLLKEKIKKHLEKTPQHWHPNHNVVVKEIENVNKLKMALYCTHTMNFQEYGEKNKRRSELVIEIKKIFEEINIKYYLLPQQSSPQPCWV